MTTCEEVVVRSEVILATTCKEVILATTCEEVVVRSKVVVGF